MHEPLALLKSYRTTRQQSELKSRLAFGLPFCPLCVLVLVEMALLFRNDVPNGVL